MNVISEKCKPLLPRGKRRLKRSEDLSMSRLEKPESVEEDNNQYYIVCDELKAYLKVTSQPVFLL